jgi:hypothetical protein
MILARLQPHGVYQCPLPDRKSLQSIVTYSTMVLCADINNWSSSCSRNLCSFSCSDLTR